MACENSAEKACGTILFCLKMSKLNYMVKETPFSAYVTIRKKFVKSPEPNFETPPLERENTNLQRKKVLLIMHN